MKRRVLAVLALALIASMALTACGTGAKESEGPFKAAFINIGPPGDLGWSYEHDRGRKAVEAEFGDAVETTYIESVEEGPDAARVIRQYAQEGYDMIFATSYGYMDPMYEVAEEFPDVIFEHNSGYKTLDNMATYFGRIYQPRYLAGLVAGSMTEVNSIGYVAAFPIPEVIRGIDAFTLGVREVNPEATVNVVWTNTWYDPVKEREAAIALLDSGVDIIAQHQDTTEPQKAAQERGALSIGYDSDMRARGRHSPHQPYVELETYYIDTIKQAMDGGRPTSTGVVSRTASSSLQFSPKVPQDVRDLVAAAQEAITKNDDIFCGPINAQDGSVLVAEGACMDDATKLSLMTFVEGVVGTIPSSKANR